MLLTLDYLVKAGAVPPDTEQVNNFEDMLIPKEDYVAGKMVGKVPTIDKPIWVGYSLSIDAYFIGYEKGLVGKFDITREVLVVKKEKRKGLLTTISFIGFDRKFCN